MPLFVALLGCAAGPVQRHAMAWCITSTCFRLVSHHIKSHINLPLSVCLVVSQGLYTAIKDASILGLPMYITETGLADEKDRIRAQCVRTYFAEVRGWVQCGRHMPVLTEGGGRA
jgi:hypothetical protein